MSTTPGLVWQNLWAENSTNTATAFQWSNPSLMAGNPPAVTMPHGDILKAGVLTIGSASTVYPITISLAPYTAAISVSAGISDLAAGMLLAPSSTFYDGVVPSGLQIIDVNTGAGTILCGGKDAMADFLDGMTVAEMTAANDGLFVNGPATFNDFPFVAIDEYPYGTLAATVTPSTGTTIVDWNMDGGNLPGPTTGNGSAMSNSGGQAMGYFGVTFADAGTFTLEVAYTSSDPDYGNTSSSTTVVVT